MLKHCWEFDRDTEGQCGGYDFRKLQHDFIDSAGMITAQCLLCINVFACTALIERSRSMKQGEGDADPHTHARMHTR